MELLDVAQAAEYLGLSKARVRQFCGEGRLGQKVGSRWVIEKGDLERFAKIPRKVGRGQGEAGEKEEGES